MKPARCSVEGCTNPGRLKRGWCPLHYQRWRKYGDPEYSLKRPMSFRFWDKVLIGDGCWEWNASKNHAGYGQFGRGGRSNVSAHRTAWELWYGDVPASLSVCHHCDNPSCVRPDHLFLGTQKDNLADMHAKGRPSRRAVWTHCPKGHPYGESRNGRRSCPECIREWHRAWRKKHRYCAICVRYKPMDHVH